MRKLLFIFLCFLSCQDEISLEFPIESQKLVVEGGIEPNMPPYVILSKNQGYFDEINANTYNDLFVYDAEVVVWTLDENGVADSVYLQPLPPPLDSIPVFTDINYLFSLTNPPYANSNGYPFSKENKTYNLITIDFLTLGKDGYSNLKKKVKVKYDLHKLLIEYFSN